jgi:tetratricopeptide repeat protein
MLSDCALWEIGKRSRILKEIVSLDDNTRLCKIALLLKTISDDDDAYFLGYLYAILIDIYLKRKDSAKVIFYTNKLLLISGMSLYEYCGNFCPFTSEKIPQLLDAYEQEEKAGNYMEIWGKGRILQLQNKFEEAISFYQNIITKQPDNANAYRMCARVYEEIHDFSHANDYFAKAKELIDDPLTSCMIANIEIKQFNFTKAETILKETMETHPNSSIAEYRLVLYRLHKDNKQEDHRKLLLKNHPANTKYILYTIQKYDEETKKELEQILSAVKDGYNYTSVNTSLGEWYTENRNDDNTFEQDTKALEYYDEAIKNNKYCYSAYYNKINILMRIPAVLLDKASKSNAKEDFIKTFKTTFPYYIEDHLNFTYSGFLLEKQIKTYTKKIRENPLKIDLYFLLADVYLQKDSRSHKNDIIYICKEVTEKFRSSSDAFFRCYFYYLTIKEYKKAKFCINKCLEYSGNYARIRQLSESIEYFIHPHAYEQLIKSTEEKFKDDLDSRFYLELAGYYFDECYNLHGTNKGYPDISLDLMEKAIDKDSKVLDDHGNRLVYALLLMYSKREKEAYKTYRRLSEEQYDLLKQIKICWDIFDINLLYKLFTHSDEQNEKNSNDHTKNIKFLTHLLLYLLQYNLFNDQEYAISHYTSINALSSMLSDDGMSPFRLCSLGSANDPKEGKILYDFLSTELSKKDVYLQVQNTAVKKYTAVQASFTKLEDALTMFRLYGKVEKNEGTGVNLVFNEHFFSDKLETPLRKKQQNIDHSEDKKDSIDFYDKNTMQQTEPLYWVLYWDKKHNKMYFNPQDIYKTLEIDLDNHEMWHILNKHQKELQEAPDTFYAKYAANISFVLNELRKEFTAHITHHNTTDDIDRIKELLLDISYLIKDIAFYDEKELRMIKVESITGNDKLKHDKSSFTLYKDYSKLSGFYHYPKTSVLDKIIIGPKVEQKETLKEYLLHHLDKAGMGFVTVEISNAPLA